MPRKARKRTHRLGTIHPRGPQNWAIRWREGGRRRYSGGDETRELAEQVRAKIVADLAAGRAGLPEEPKAAPTLATLAGEWLAALVGYIRVQHGYWGKESRSRRQVT